MPRIAFLTISELGEFVADDELAVEPLARRGCAVESLPWDADADWSLFRAAVIRSTWDYQDRMEEFDQALARIVASGCRLFNPLEIVRWNSNKRYLEDLADRGVPVVPTLFRGPGEPIDLAGFFARFQCHDLVIKPTVGASAFDTFRVRNEGGGSRGPASRSVPVGGVPIGDVAGPSRFGGPVPILPLTRRTEEQIEETFRGREYMVQPFVREILEPGETSIFYFNGRFSHAVLKTPRQGDFRVQEEHGGLITLCDPPRDLVETCGTITRLLEPEPLYARVDVVRTGELFLLMELELIEPALYFRIAPGSADRFAEALVARLEVDG